MEATKFEGHTSDLVSHVIVNDIQVTAEEDGLALRFFSQDADFIEETVVAIPWAELRGLVNEMMRVGKLV